MNKFIIIISLIFSSLLCYSQNVNIVEPEFSGTIVHVNNNGCYALPLKISKLILKRKASASVYITGIGKATTSATVKGSTES